jgi:tRNA(Ile2) C34 agmatinyltransferase TiaS
MNSHPHHENLSRFSAHLEKLFSQVSDYEGQHSLPQELADEIASTAGEIMVELADHRGDELVLGAIEDARRLRVVVRTICPESTIAAAAGRTLALDLALVIREDKRAA